MTQLTKKQQEEGAWETYRVILNQAWEECDAIVNRAQEAYEAIADRAWEAYEAKLKEINAQPDKAAQIITKNGRQYKLIKEEQ